MTVSGLLRRLLLASVLWVQAVAEPRAEDAATPGKGTASEPETKPPGPEPARPDPETKPPGPEPARPDPETKPPAPDAKEPAPEGARAPAAPEPTPEPAREAEPAKPAAGEPPTAPAEGSAGGKVATGKIELGGALEMEAHWAKVCGVPSAGTPCRTRQERGIALTAAEFDFEAKIVPWAKAELAVEWVKEAAAPSGPTGGSAPSSRFDLNEAFITVGETSPVTLKAGVGKVPFGISTGSTIASKLEDTLTVTDPLTIQIFDAKEEYLSLQGKYGGFHATLYAFEGSTRGTGRNREHYGGNVGYSAKSDTGEITVGLGLIESVFDADELSAAYPEALAAGWTPALAAHLKVSKGRFQLGLAYYGALGVGRFVRRLTGANTTTMRVQPEAWHLEGGYTREILGRRTVLALSYSQSYGVGACPQTLPGGTTCTALSQFFPETFPRQRAIASASRWLRENMRVAVEYVHAEDYPPSKRGNGTSTSRNFLGQFLYEW